MSLACARCGLLRRGYGLQSRNAQRWCLLLGWFPLVPLRLARCGSIWQWSNARAAEALPLSTQAVKNPARRNTTFQAPHQSSS